MEKVIQWTVFGVLLSIAPLGVALLIKLTRSQSIALTDILSNGELLLVTAGIVGAAIGDLLAGKHKHSSAELISGGGCVVILLVSCIYFADVSAAHASQSSINSAAVERASYWLFGSGFISSLVSIILSEL